MSIPGWYGLTLMEKELAAKGVAVCYGMTDSMRIMDAHTGRELAYLSLVTGYRNYEGK
jgi:hypothetical protein